MADTRYGAWLRERRGDTAQKTVADRCAGVPGVRQSHISLIEKGEFLPNGEQHAAMAAALGLSDDEAAAGAALLRQEHLDRLRLADDSEAA